MGRDLERKQFPQNFQRRSASLLLVVSQSSNCHVVVVPFFNFYKRKIIQKLVFQCFSNLYRDCQKCHQGWSSRQIRIFKFVKRYRLSILSLVIVKFVITYCNLGEIGMVKFVKGIAIRNGHSGKIAIVKLKLSFGPDIKEKQKMLNLMLGIVILEKQWPCYQIIFNG